MTTTQTAGNNIIKEAASLIDPQAAKKDIDLPPLDRKVAQKLLATEIKKMLENKLRQLKKEKNILENEIKQLEKKKKIKEVAEKEKEKKEKEEEINMIEKVLDEITKINSIKDVKDVLDFLDISSSNKIKILLINIIKLKNKLEGNNVRDADSSTTAGFNYGNFDRFVKALDNIKEKIGDNELFCKLLYLMAASYIWADQDVDYALRASWFYGLSYEAAKSGGNGGGVYLPLCPSAADALALVYYCKQKENECRPMLEKCTNNGEKLRPDDVSTIILRLVGLR